ncbi:CBS domain-containing protein [Amycolatopsis pittospori]|uniref:CBS domain-containing protein n=1 Tax=Amycolatopsis pittospori TaxID=2749434 RepID=UPI0015F04577|nr:CBS domain-containing protein [Amycolatopsis pittospori]
MTGTTVGDVMTRGVYSVRKSTPIADIARILAGRGISAVPVVDHDRDVVGVVSEADLLLKQAEGASVVRAAEDVMTSPAVTVEAGKPLQEAARLMVGHRVKRLPVVDRYGKLTGIVSRADLVRALVRTDADILGEVDQDLLVLIRRPSRGEVHAQVTDGIVTLTGTVERRSQSVLLDALIRRVAGVVDVIDRVEFTWDDEANRPAG